MQARAIRIIGIDPGLRRTGWGIVEAEGARLSYVASRLVASDAEEDLAYRLRAIYEGLMGVIGSFRPQEAAVEETFVNKDARATLKLGQARGMALLAPAQKGLPVAEYPPNVVKKTVTGTGHGEKRQIAAMVGFLLPKAKFESADEADALAIAICHASHRQSARAIAARARRGAAVRFFGAGRQASPPSFVGRGQGGGNHMTASTSSRPSLRPSPRGRRDRRRGGDGRHDRQAQGHRRCGGRGARHHRRQRGGLRGAGLVAHAAHAAGGRAGEPRHRDARGEDAIRLFGFTSEVERAWFRTLQTIQGVGAKVALAVLGTLSPQDLANAIALQNWAAVEQSPGVGKKLAQRIVAELRARAQALSVAGLNVPASGRKGGPASTENSAAAEAISALTNLGYQPAQASQAVAAAIAELGQEADTPKLIRRGLKELAR